MGLRLELWLFIGEFKKKMAFAENLEYLNLNSLRSYPIRTGLTKLDVTEQFKIPDSLLVDAQLSIPDGTNRRCYISSIFNKISSFEVEITDDEATVLGRFAIDATTHTSGDSYKLTTIGNFANGRLVVGDVSVLQYLPAGNFQFTLAAAEFEPRVILPSSTGVSAISFTDVRGNDIILTGIVNILGRNNIRFRYDNDSNTVFFDAGDGLGLNKNCSSSQCIQTINGVTPNPDTGNISILGVRCSSVTSPSAATIQLEDNCCTPCSGCDELGVLTDRLVSLESKYIDLKNLYVNAKLQLTAFLSIPAVTTG